MYQLQEICKTQKNVWDMLATVTIEQGLDAFLSTLKYHTKRCYRTAINNLFKMWEDFGMINRRSSLQTFAMCNLENLLDSIRQNLSGSEATKQNRSAAFISFTKYLYRVTGRLIPIAVTKSGIDATFCKIRSKAATKALTLEEWNRFSAALQDICYRDYLIAKAIFQGAKRCGEVLESRIENINWEDNAIRYRQFKSHVFEDATYIYYSKEYMKELKEYLGDRTHGYIFITRTGCPVTQPQIYRNFAYASIVGNLKVRVHPHMLRASAITSLLKMGYHSDQIMSVSGHSNPAMVLYYDKTPIEDNITKEIKLC